MDNMDSIATAYVREAGAGDGSYTPDDGNYFNATTVTKAQTNWANQANDPDGGKEDGNYNAVNMGFEQMNQTVTTLNQSTTTLQKYWSNVLDEFQSADKD